MRREELDARAESFRVDALILREVAGQLRPSVRDKIEGVADRLLGEARQLFARVNSLDAAPSQESASLDRGTVTDAAGNTQLQPAHIADLEVGRFLTVQEHDGTRWAICDFLSRHTPTGSASKDGGTDG